MRPEKVYKRRRLLHLQLLPLLTGVQNVTVSEFESLDVEEFEPILVCAGEGPLTQAMTRMNIEFHCVSALRREISPILDIVALSQLVMLFRRLRPDIVHTHSSKTGILGRLAATIVGVPIVIHTVHGFSFPAAGKCSRLLYRFLERVAGHCCDFAVVLNDADRNVLVSELGIASSKVVKIPNGVNVSKFFPGDHYLREIQASPKNVMRFLVVGRLWRQKNPECVIDAAELLPPSIRERILIQFVGAGELEEGLVKRVQNAGLNASVQFLGWRDDVASLLREADGLILASLWEGMPLVILEAMASGTLVVASDIEPHKELITSKKNGVLFETKSAAALACALEWVIKNQGALHEMRVNAFGMVHSKYSIRIRNERVFALYRT